MNVPVSVEIASQLVDRAFAEAQPTLSPWMNDELLRENLATEIARDVAARDERMHIVALSNGRLAAIHVPREGDPRPKQRALVQHRSFGINSMEELRELGAAVRSAISPKPVDRLLVFMHGERLEHAPPADYLVAGRIDEMRVPAEVNSPENLRLVVPDSLDFYEQYRAWYEEFWRRRPHLRDIWIETQADLEDCLNQRGLRLIYLGDECCGMLAAQRRVEYGLRGWRMRERVTAPHRWGQGISTAAFVPFAHSLEHDGADAIWGNILPSNTSSLDSALRLGRRIIGTYYDA